MGDSGDADISLIVAGGKGAGGKVKLAAGLEGLSGSADAGFGIGFGISAAISANIDAETIEKFVDFVNRYSD